MLENFHNKTLGKYSIVFSVLWNGYFGGLKWSNNRPFFMGYPNRRGPALGLLYFAPFIWQGVDTELHLLPVTVLSWTTLLCAWQRLSVFGTDSLTYPSLSVSGLCGSNQISSSVWNFLSPVSSKTGGSEVGQGLSLCGLLWGSALLASCRLPPKCIVVYDCINYVFGLWFSNKLTPKTHMPCNFHLNLLHILCQCFSVPPSPIFSSLASRGNFL